ncbi:MAG: hypothetical protein K9I99_15110 [Melioribacteraceae bacterium]|nr:hypothetical protein [Melioribacteraceae bacterium]MCF8414554.1 hypothetical protein [Melioribacteraceae bacterium]
MAKPYILDLMRPGKWNGINVSKEFINQIFGATRSREYQDDKFPFVKGHPKDDDPAYGWGEKESLFVDSDGHLKLKTTEESYHPSFLKELKEKLFGPVSIKLRPEDLSIKHVGFFGAKPTAVTGLEPAFSENDKSTIDNSIEVLLKNPSIRETETELVVEFAEYEVSRYQLRDNVNILRNIKNFFIEKFGLEEADKVMPEHLLQNIDEPLRVWEKPNHSFSEKPQTKSNFKSEETMTDQEIQELKDKADRLERENQSIKNKLQFSETEKKLNAALQFCESENIKKKLPPAIKNKVAHVIAHLDDKEQHTLEFKEDENDVKVNAVEVVTELISMLPDLEFGEVAKNGKREQPVEDAEYEAGKKIAEALNT